MNSSLIRKIGLSLILIFNLVNGYIRYAYVINFTDESKPYIYSRKDTKQYEYPTGMEKLKTSAKKDPRWISVIYYCTVAILSTLLSIYLLFDKRKWVVLAALFYLFLILVCVFLLVFSIVSKSYYIGYGLAQDIKNLIQTPFFSLFLIATIYLFNKPNDRSKALFSR